jgi:membrane protease YdiL (CAAX protease family)
VAILVACVLSVVSSGSIALLAAVQRGLSWRDPHALASLNRDPSILGSLILAQATIMALTALVAARLSPVAVRQRLALTPSGLRGWRLWAVGGAATVAAIAAGGAAEAAALLWTGGELSSALLAFQDAFKSAHGGSLVLLISGAVIAAPLGEELFFRGYVQSRLMARWGAAAGLVLSSLLFAAAHMDVMHAVAVLPLGLVLGYTALRTGSIWTSMGMHAVNNTLAIVSASEAREAAFDASGYLHWSLFYAAVAGLALYALHQLTRELSSEPSDTRM